MPIAPDMLVDDVMQRWPATIRVFLDLRMRCVGCPIACFHTVADAAREHGIAREALLVALRSAVEARSTEQRRRFVPATAGPQGPGSTGFPHAQE